MTYSIRNITLEDIGDLKEISEKDGLLFPKVSPTFIGVYSEKQLIAFGGWVIKGKKAIIKCDYVKPEYRKQGIGRHMLSTRIEILRGLGIKKIEANATKLAINMHKSAGARVVKEFKNGITQVIYENI